ncbi:MAG: TonB-dependent receptor family protein [Opitutales bacterium]
MSLSTAGLAGSDESSPVFELDPVIVEAVGLEAPVGAIPAAVSVVGRAEVQDASAQLSINEALRTVPGVFVLNPYNFAQDSRIAIRGFGAQSDFGIRGVRLVVDGIPATLPDGQSGVDGIDLGAVEQIEVIRGPAAAIYGPAAGGVIRIRTEDPPARPFAELRLTGGDYGLEKSQFKAGGSEGPLGVLLSATHLDYDGYRANSRVVDDSLNMKLRYQFETAGELTTVFRLTDSPKQGDPGGLTAAEAANNPRQARDRNLQFDAGERVRQEELGVDYRKPLSEDHELRLQGFAVQRDFANKLPFTDGGQVSFDRLYYGGGASYTYSAESFRLLGGAEFGQQSDARRRYDNLEGRRGELALEQDEDVLNLGAYALFELALPRAVTFSAAARYDEVRFDVTDHFLADGDDSGKITFRETSPMLGIRWEPSPEVTFYANASTAFQTPTTTEFADPSGGGFNNALAAEKALQFEAGVKTQFPNLPWQPSLDLAVFKIEIDDALVPFELPGSPGRDFFRNAGSSSRSGVEAALRLIPGERWLAAISYTYSDFSYDDFTTPDGDFSGNRLPGVPEHFANLRLGYEDPSGFSLIWNTRFVGALQANDANTTEVSGYSFSDLRLRWERDFGDWTVEGFAGVNNIFDKAYSANIRINAFGGRYFEPAPDRNLYAGLRLRYWFGTVN